MKEERKFTADGETFTYTLERKNVKRMRLYIYPPDGVLYVSANTRTTRKHIEEFLQSQVDFIRRTRKKMAEKRANAPKPLQLVSGEVLPLFGEPHTICVCKDTKRRAGCIDGTLYLSVCDPNDAVERYRCFCEFLDRTAKKYFTDMVARALPYFQPKPAKMPTLWFRTMKTKWGVCNYAKGKITLNRSLVYFPPSIAQYVVYHELAHFTHPNHSQYFWKFLAERMPDCKERRKALNAYPLPKIQDPQA